MPRYNFACEPCDEHNEKIVREVFMSISYFDEEGRHQVCDKCGKDMVHILGMPAVHWKGPGATPHKKQIPAKDAAEMETDLTQHYIDKAIKGGNFDEARERTESYVIDEYKDEKTGKKVRKPVHIPAVES
jgi:ssDNA-binding Zn-finger/Zn-ribbon topoisomerase 1